MATSVAQTVKVEKLEPSILELFRGALARIFLYFRGFAVQLLY